jgi:hypothetical protein
MQLMQELVTVQKQFSGGFWNDPGFRLIAASEDKLLRSLTSVPILCVTANII